MFNNLIIRHLIGFMIIKKRLLGVLLTLFLSMQNRGVLQYFRMGCCWCKVLIFSVLNNIFTLEFAKESMYLCRAKVPYNGRFEDRHRAHDYASPLRDAAGSRGIVCKGWRNV